MTDQEQETIATRMSDRIMSAVQTAERLARVEVQTNRIASDLESEKETRARSTERAEKKLEDVRESLHSLQATVNKSSWAATGAIGVFLILWEVFKHFVKF